MALIEDSELEQLKNVAQTGLASKNLLDAMGRNPKTRAQILRLMKEVAPNLAIPEIDAAAPVLDALKGVVKRLDDKDAEEEAAKRRAAIDTEIEANRRKLREQGWTKEGIDGIEKLMQTEGLFNYEAAAALFEKKQEKERMIAGEGLGNYGPSNFIDNLPEENPWREAVNMPKGAKQDRVLRRIQNQEAQKALAELRAERFGRQ